MILILLVNDRFLIRSFKKVSPTIEIPKTTTQEMLMAKIHHH